LSEDFLLSSLQSKYIKFLRFLRDFPEFKKYNQILYFDHKIEIKQEHIDRLQEIYEEFNHPNIIMRKHEKKRTGIFTEIEDSLNFDKYLQEDRYTKNMDKTIEFVNKNVKEKGIDEKDIEIVNTGLILYSNYNEIMPLLDEVYETCTELQQPQCQIVWCVLSQKYKDKIKAIDFYDVVNPKWAEPFSTNIDNSNNDGNWWFILFILFAAAGFFYVFLKKSVLLNLFKKRRL